MECLRVKDENIISWLITIHLTSIFKKTHSDIVREKIKETIAVINTIDFKDYRRLLYNNLFLIGVNDNKLTMTTAMISTWVSRIHRDGECNLNEDVIVFDGKEYEAKLPKNITEREVNDLVQICLDIYTNKLIEDMGENK